MQRSRLSRRQTFVDAAFGAECLEPRLCLAYALSDYYPLAGNQTWGYSGVADGFTVTANMLSDSGIVEGGVSTTRLRTQVQSVNGTFTNSRFWNQSGAGLKLLREDHAQYTQTDRYPSGGLLVVGSTFDADQVFSYSARATSTSPGGSGQQDVEGTLSIFGEEEVITPAGVFSAIKFIQNGTSSIVGSTAHGERTETQWLVKGLGIVKLQYTEIDHYSNGSQATYTALLNLTASSLLRPQAAVLGNGAPIASGDTAPSTADGTNYGSVEASGGSRDRTFSVANTGTRVLYLTNSANGYVRITGANANRFVVIAQPAGSIAPGATTQFTVRFAPNAQTGAADATIAFSTNDPARPVYSFSVQGTGLAQPRAQVSGNQVVITNGDTTPTTADWSKFAGIDALYMTKVRIFNIKNTGLATLNLTGATPVTISGPNADRFLVFVQPALSLAPGASTQFRVRFTPGGQVGFSNATISIESGDPTTPVYSFAIQGNGLALPRAQLSSVGVIIATGDGTPSTTDNTDFGSVVTTGNNVRVRLFTLTNVGLATLILTGANFVSITGSNALDFVVSALPSTGALAPGESVTFRVRFNPTATGARSASVVVDTNENVNLSPSRGHYTFDVAGIGT